MSLHLPSGSKISITRDVIAVVFGLPCETVTITECDSRGKVTVTALYNELLTHNNAGIWFKRHFSVVVVSTLIESEHNGYVNQKIAHMFDDTNRDSKARLVWVLIEMLATIYADRVVVGSRDNTRERLVLKGWTSKLLKQREAREISVGGFGLGYLDTPLHL
nr:uncharacterized protein LOC109155364 [Ipomoea batatas]